jgi:predicted SprT family Zn-dependent metalloprotease
MRLRILERWRRRGATNGQLELALPSREAAPAAPADPAAAFLERLRALGLRRIERCTLTNNRATMVSYSGPALRVHRAFVDASPEMLRAVVGFVNGRGAVRREARRVLRTFEALPPAGDDARPRRVPASHPDDARLVEKLRAAHGELNAARFGGALGTVTIRVSRRMRSRLGHYSPGLRSEPEIAIARRHARRDGWASVVETLVHEMVHQWQHENRRPIAHDPDFRRKCREVGIPAHAKRKAEPRASRP